ncbi:MAG: C25 family cysteine peptidase, partial [Candidatus Eisenbacteria bacterium]
MNIRALLLLSVSMLLPVGCLAYSIELEYGWEISDLKVVSAGDYDLLGVEGGVLGGGSLGAVNDLRLLPDGYRVEGYEILWEEWRETGRGFRLGIDSGAGLTEMPGDDPGGITFIGSGGFLGYTALMVVVQPTRVINGRVSVLARMGLRVDCAYAGGTRTGPEGETRPAVKRRSPVADRLVTRLIESRVGVEVDPFRTWQVEDHRDWVSTGPGLDGGVVDCVIVTGDSLAGEFERLAAMHDRLGIRTVVRSMSWISNRYGGSDGPERVRNFITDAYENWGTIYVLLGGDIDVVPMRILDYPRMEPILETSVMPSDVYYTNLDGTWNADGDDIIGEYGPGTNDGIDVFPDVFVGRAPVTTTGEARLFVDKTMHYLRGSNPGVWHRTVLSLAQMIDKYSDGAIASEGILEHFPDHFRQVRLYENYTNYPGSLPETMANMIAYMDSGCGILSHIGHGDEFRLDLGNEFMERFHIQSAGNDTAYYFLYMMNCSSSDPLVESVAKAFLKDPDGGAFGALGNSALAFPGTGLAMEEDFFEYVFSEGSPTIGAISAVYRIDYLTSDYLNSWWMYLNFILMGDPVVRLWTGEPVALDVIDSGTMQLSDSVYVVDVQDGGMPVDGAVVV